MIRSKPLRETKLNRKQTQHITQFYKTEGNLTVHDVEALVERMKERGDEKFKKFGVTKLLVLNGDQWSTYDNVDDLSEYYRGKVKDVQKFLNFSQIQVTTYYEN
jgi:hypothetical protein